MSDEIKAFDHVVAVLPAGGMGTRMELDIPKQFVLVNGKPLYMYALETFVHHPKISRIALVIPDNAFENVQAYLSSCEEKNNSQPLSSKVILVKGGQTRHRSIKNGVDTLFRELGEEILDEVQCLEKYRSKIVLIHDAVRPFVDNATLEAVIDAAQQFGAAGLVRPLVSTIVKPDLNGFLTETLVREEYRASEMPQAFQLSLLQKAYSSCTIEELDHGTECLELFRKYSGVCPKLLDGPNLLWKVTHKKDLDLVEMQLKKNKC